MRSVTTVRAWVVAGSILVASVLLTAAVVVTNMPPASERAPLMIDAPAALLAPAVPTPAPTEPWSPPPPIYRRAPAPSDSSPEAKGAAALAVITFPIELTGYSLAFVGPRKGIEGWTSSTAQQITVYVRPTQSADDVARVLAHELGHVVDQQRLDDAERALYRRMRGLDDRPWYPCLGCADDTSPAGDFAEVFAWWLRGPGSFKSALAPAPTNAELERLSSLWR